MCLYKNKNEIVDELGGTNGFKNVSLFGKSRLNENSVVVLHYIFNALKMHWRTFPLHFETLAIFLNRTEMRCKSISKSFQNIVNAFSNIDNTFSEAAGRLESFIEPLLSVIKIFTTKCFSMNSSTYSIANLPVLIWAETSYTWSFRVILQRARWSLVKLKVSYVWLLLLTFLASVLMVLNHRHTGIFGLAGAVTILPKKITQCPKACVVQTHSNRSKNKNAPISYIY